MKQEISTVVNKESVLTIPNLLTLIRLLLIGPIVWAFAGLHDSALMAVLLTVSGATDILDGWIARHFHMISAFGKAVDPLADKLTQFAVLVCLATRYRVMRLPLAMLVIKEAASGLMGWMVFRRTGEVLGAQWHGKLVTCMLYALMIAHILWQEMPAYLSNTLTSLCMAMMALSFTLYAMRNIRAIQGGKRS
ncbi:MAG: CDP-alcohol phosphatidyltransferase family protein [Christensenellaceae bacterium]|nr:CDP-alcohol phosphatidyltransferase family protein [Christensenellaceae bacterium]